MHDASALRIWLATGRRHSMLRTVQVVVSVVALLLSLGPAVIAAPAANGGLPPPPLRGGPLLPRPVTLAAAEQLLGSPLLDAPAFHQGTRDLGLWAATIEGPFGRTVVVSHVYATSHRTWLTLLELHSEQPINNSPLLLIVAQPVQVAGHDARLYLSPGSISVGWQESPTLQVSLSEDAQQPSMISTLSEFSARAAGFDEAAFLRLAASLHPHGTQVGPFRLDFPWM